MNNIISKIARWRRPAAVASAVALLGVSACTEKIDESNLYTFTGETITDYLANRPDSFSSFSYILQRSGMDKVLSAYGMYTCFAPTNEAVKEYIDSLYDDTSNRDFEHNGMTARGLEGLSDSLCTDIAMYHLLPNKMMLVEMSGNVSAATMLGRDITTSIDSLTGYTVVNSYSAITNFDNELENGVLHEVNHALRRSNRLLPGELSQHPEFSIYTEALKITGLEDSLLKMRKDKEFRIENNPGGMYVPKTCLEGYTFFAETDELLRSKGINSFEDMVQYANNIYKDADQWYDYMRERGIKPSTGTDYDNPFNCVNMFIRYHILVAKISYDMLTVKGKATPSAPIYDYYETMLPYTLMKVSLTGGKHYLNRWVSNSTLTDRVGEVGSDAIQVVKHPGVEVKTDNIQGLNAYIHPITDILVYDDHVPHGVLNERMRFDVATLLPELMSNSCRQSKYTTVKALNGGVSGKIEGTTLNGDYFYFAEGFFDNIKVYNGENTRVCYLSGDEEGSWLWVNYQQDEFNCSGAYDFALRLPPVPTGVYELRLGYSANAQRGMLQFYLGTSSDRSSMKALDIPLDMRHVAKDDGTEDVVTGWIKAEEKTDDQGLATDASMRNLGYMRGPKSYTDTQGNFVVREGPGAMRRILTRQTFKQGDYWLRFKTVLPDQTGTEFMLDYIELVPTSVYNNAQYAEDMF